MLSFDLTEVWFWIWMFFHSQVTSKQKYYKKPPQKTKQNKKNRHMDSALMCREGLRVALRHNQESKPTEKDEGQSSTQGWFSLRHRP